MKTQTMTAEQIRSVGLKALADSLGPVGMVRFLQLFEVGEGDYVEERQQLLGQEGVDRLAQRIWAARDPPHRP